jgi:carbon storage regulator
MLVLTRKVREVIVIPELNLTLTVLEIHSDRVRLGVSAPLEVKVHRAEVWRRILGDAKEAEKAGVPV